MTGPRYRTKQFTSWENASPYGPRSEWTETNQAFYESAYPGSNQCDHWKVSPIPWKITFPNHGGFRSGQSDSGAGFILPVETIRYLVQSALPIHGELNRAKLLTTSDFNLLVAVAELDDTLGMFTQKFLRDMSYGSLKWGVMPFVSELSAIAAQARNLNKRMADNAQQYEDESTRDVNVVDGKVYIHNVGDIYYDITGVSRVRYTGNTTTPGSPILEAYDRIGFHPDLLTAWDIVPLSFVVDYFLPVGSFIESVVDRGWIKAVNFTGWKTHLFKGTFTLKRRVAHNRDPLAIYDCSNDVTLFNRSALNAYVLEDSPRIDEQLSRPRPKLTQLADTLYILLSMRR